MNGVDELDDSWYKRCSECNEWRVTDMKHCWKCGAVLGPAHSLAELMTSKRAAIIDVNRIRCLWERAKENGYEHKLPDFIEFFQALNQRRK